MVAEVAPCNNITGEPEKKPLNPSDLQIFDAQSMNPL